MSQTHRGAIQEERTRGRPGSSGLASDNQLLEDVIAALLHGRQWQPLPCLIIGPRMTRRRFTAIPPPTETLTRPRPKAGRQTSQEFQYGVFQRRPATQPLCDQQPHHYQRRVNTVVAVTTVGLESLVDKGGRQQFQEQRNESREGGSINDWRERECWSCLKSQDSRVPLRFKELCYVFLFAIS